MRTLSNRPPGPAEVEVSDEEWLDESQALPMSWAHGFSIELPGGVGVFPARFVQGNDSPTISLFGMNGGVAVAGEAVVAATGPQVTGSDVFNLQVHELALFPTPGSLFTTANEEILLLVPRPPRPYERLGREFGIRVAFLESVAQAIAGYVRQHPQLSLSVERTVDPDVGRAVQLAFEVQGTRSFEETTKVWDDLEAALDGISASQDDRDALIEKIGVHVHRGSV